jgi:hypothetical protein
MPAFHNYLCTVYFEMTLVPSLGPSGVAHTGLLSSFFELLASMFIVPIYQKSN